jgi:hypothetical protein
MIAHVAAAGERRGRVVLWLGSSARASASAIDAAMLLARVFQSEVESLFVEDRQLFDLANFPFARAMASPGEGWRALPQETLEREMRFAGAALQRQVAEAAKLAAVPCHARVVRDDPLRAISRACAENGPWNIVIVGEPLAPGDEPRLSEVFERVRDTTGVVIAGPLARRGGGPVVAVVEEFERLGPMLKAALRLAGETGSPVKLMLVGDRREELTWMDGEARLLCADEDDEPALETVLAAQAEAAPVIAALGRHKAGFVLAQFGGRLVSAGSSLRPLAAALECPLLLVR